MLDLKGLDGFFLRNNGVECGAELGNVPLSVADLIELPPDCMLRRDCECVAEGAVRKADGQIWLEHEDAFADRLHDIQRVDVMDRGGSTSCRPAAPPHLPMTSLIFGIKNTILQESFRQPPAGLDC